MFPSVNRFFGEMPGRNFLETYRCYSVSMLSDRDDVERGGKIIMPPSALDKLISDLGYKPLDLPGSRLLAAIRKTLSCCQDQWNDILDNSMPLVVMMKNLLLNEGDLIQIENVSLPIATFAKFEPQHTEFLDISNPKAVLENALRSFACLTIEDLIEFRYNDKIYELRVLETKPGKAVSIIECDMNVDFAPPLGYKEPERFKPHEHQEHMEHEDVSEEENMSFKVFQGKGNRLDGKTKGLEVSQNEVSICPAKRGIPNYNYKKNTITFIRTPRRVENGISLEDKKMFEAFGGQGQSLRSKEKLSGRK